ncbi:unnamed protein product [Eruca vesicaria subsp. sativa]|uniref:Cryptochrome/DNA photolyase FAD-binding domain-containing protein n=1 Tax=Eruca vesicaria subsp. sativa TaxID=29727 RepID=A0ABC8JV73_ERUVS|nr:unnamed protein product [Eruca vesicaria subsp. sativa]
MYHKDDLPFDVLYLPDIFTQFRKYVEAKCRIRSSTRIPISLGPTPYVDDWGDVPTLSQLGIEPQEVSRGMRFLGGSFLSIHRDKDRMLGPDYSTKFSPWIAVGCISPRFIHEEVVQEMCKVNGVEIKNCLSLGEMARPVTVHEWLHRYPIIHANMKELSTTDFMSNRGRQIVCLFLVRDMGLDWRMGA